MSPDVNPLRSNLPKSPAGGAGGEGLRNQYDGGGGRGGRGKDRDGEEDEKEKQEEPAEEEGYLDTDTFSGRKARSVIDNLFSEDLPWEREEADKLEALKRKREELARRGGTTGRLGTGLPARRSSGPLGRSEPLTEEQAIGGLKVPPLPGEQAGRPARRPLPAQPSLGTQPLGRRIEENFDPTAALNNTLAAQQALRDRQREREQREREEAERRALEAARDISGIAQILRPEVAHQPSTPPPAGPSLRPDAPLRPEIEQAPVAPRPPGRGSGQLNVRLPSTEDVTSAPPGVVPGAPAARAGSGQLPRPPQARRGSGRLDPADAAGAGRGAAPPAGRPAAGPSRPATPPAATARSAEVPPSRAGHSPAPPQPEPPSWAMAPEPEPETLSRVVPAAEPEPAPTRQAEAAEAPPVEAPPESPPPINDHTRPKVSAGQVSAACVYRVIDAATNLPLAGVRIELEPVEDDMLPNVHGQTDLNGWFGSEGLPPGEYRIAIRAVGYVPAYKNRVLEPSVVDDLALFISRP